MSDGELTEREESAVRTAATIFGTKAGRGFAIGALTILVGSPLVSSWVVSSSSERLGNTAQNALEEVTETTKDLGVKLDGVKGELSGLRTDFRVEQARSSGRLDLLEQRMAALEARNGRQE